VRDGLRILDADAHHMEPVSLWDEYLPAPLRERGPRVAEVHGRRIQIIEGEPVVRHREYPWPDSSVPHRSHGMLTRVRLARAGAEARLEDMDAHGVDVQILFPTAAAHLLGREYRDPALLAACCTAYNRWSRDYVRAAPDRLRWAGLVPLQDVKLAVEEAHRAADLGAVGLYVRPSPVRGRNLHHEDYVPLWTALESLGLPLCIHDGSSPQLPSYGERMSTHTAGHILSHPFEAMGAMTSLIWYGVVERFPRLRVVHLEADAGWLPWWLQRMEQHWELSGTAEHPGLTLGPTDYFRRNFWVGCRGDERTLPGVLTLVGDDRILFTTDYPHGDATWPGGIPALEAQPIPRESLRRVFWDNGARCFGL
jgi:predicted TIM-barrel fold metal-dependent hydrolase